MRGLQLGALFVASVLPLEAERSHARERGGGDGYVPEPAPPETEAETDER